MKHYCTQCGEIIEPNSPIVVYKTISDKICSIFCCDDCFDDFVRENKAYGNINERNVLELD